MSLLALPIVAAGCIFPPPIDTSGTGSYPPPAAQSETPPLSEDIIMMADVQAETVELGIEEQDPNATLYARVFIDYGALNQAPPIEEYQAPPPSGTTSSAVRTLSIDPATIPICASSPNSALEQVGPGPTPHHLTIVVADRPFDDSVKCGQVHQCVQQGGASTQVSWTFYCTPAGGDL